MVEISYRSQGKAIQRIKRRIDLLRAGVVLRQDLAIARVRRTAMGHTLLSRGAAKGEAGIVALKGMREGIPHPDAINGVGRNHLGLYATREGYEIVDIYSSLDTYLTSAVVRESASSRSILRHLGLARSLSESIDRFTLEVEEQLFWREMLPVVVSNGGYGMLYLPEASSKKSSADSLKVKGRRYEVEEISEYVLVGMNGPDESYRHIFTSGGKYLFSLVSYGGGNIDTDTVLQILGGKVAQIAN